MVSTKTKTALMRALEIRIADLGRIQRRCRDHAAVVGDTTVAA
jgi:hypothetical protein